MNEIDKVAPFSKLILQIALGERKQSYDPRTSLWQSVDSALGEYIGNPSSGRVYNPANLSLYTFAGQNPLKYVHPDGGKFTIAKAIQAQFNEAIKYLSTSSETKAVLDALESSPVEFKIQHSNEARKYGKAWAASCGSACYGDTNEVFWDPEMGLSVPGGVMSPALLLAHEFGHAIQHLTNPKKYKSDMSGAPRNSLNFNAEEERNLRFETKVANQLKEVTRKFYRSAIGFIKASTAPTAKSSSPWGIKLKPIPRPARAPP